MSEFEAMDVIANLEKLRALSSDRCLAYLRETISASRDGGVRDFLRGLLQVECMRLNFKAELIEVSLERAAEKPDAVTFVALSEAHAFVGNYEAASEAAASAVQRAIVEKKFIIFANLNRLRLSIRFCDLEGLRRSLVEFADVVGGEVQAGSDCAMEWDWVEDAVKLGVSEEELNQVKSATA